MNKCVGCGIALQNEFSDKEGYVSSIDHTLCERCFKIKNYGQSMDVSKTNVDYMAILDTITDDDIVVYVTSLLTLNLDYADKFKNVIVVLSKLDALPKSVREDKLVSYVKGRYKKCIDVIAVSSYKKINLDNLYKILNKYGKNKKIYFVGTTNSGKSTLINEMAKSYNGEMSRITTSFFPSTTLNIIKNKIGDLNIYDTPGMLVDKSIINYLDSKKIKLINSKKEIKPATFQIKGKGSILIDEFIRIDYDTKESSMTFYISNELSLKSISLKNPQLLNGNFSSYYVPKYNDLVIEDIGFIKITNPVAIKMYYSNHIHVSVRDNLI